MINDQVLYYFHLSSLLSSTKLYILQSPLSVYCKYYLDTVTPGKLYNGFGYMALQKHSMHKMSRINSIIQKLLLSDEAKKYQRHAKHYSS